MIRRHANILRESVRLYLSLSRQITFVSFFPAFPFLLLDYPFLYTTSYFIFLFPLVHSIAWLSGFPIPLGTASFLSTSTEALARFSLHTSIWAAFVFSFSYHMLYSFLVSFFGPLLFLSLPLCHTRNYDLELQEASLYEGT
jgi:hypothetical protein